MSTDNTSGKYIITPDKFFLHKGKVLCFKIYQNELPNAWYDRIIRQYLHSVGRGQLEFLADYININPSEIKNMKTPELASYMNSKIEFQIPEELLAYKRDSILDTYIDFPQIYIPLNQQDGFKFCYKPNDDKWYTYPFTNRDFKRDLALLCKNIGLMNISTASKYKIEELCELLNEKFVLQERTG